MLKPGDRVIRTGPSSLEQNILRGNEYTVLFANDVLKQIELEGHGGL